MHAPGDANSLSPKDHPAALVGEKSSAQSAAGRHISDHVYDLRRGNRCSDAFYAEVESFCDELLARVERRAGVVLDGYSRHLREFVGEVPRSRGEYAIELLTLGLALRRYEGAARNTPRWVAELARGLCSVRSRRPQVKPLVDLLRGGIARFCLAPNIGRRVKSGGGAVERLANLTVWLQATGEFQQESMRLNNWRSYLGDLKPHKATYWLRVAGELFDEFEREAAVELGVYTRGVQPFQQRLLARWRWREDLLLCGRPAVEYHLNMVAAEVMNRGLRADFERTKEKVVLVPTCMRGVRAADCRAHVDGVDIVCTGCDPDCAVNRISQQMRRLEAKVYLVPHASGFSKWLDRWEREPGVGVTAVACMLNILAGGYEMRAHGIPSQCVPLDYPGCRKHWDSKGSSTAVNEVRLVQIVAGHQ